MAAQGWRMLTLVMLEPEAAATRETPALVGLELDFARCVGGKEGREGGDLVGRA